MLCSGAAVAQEAQRATYAVYAGGFQAMVIEAKADIAATTYRMDVAYRTTGLVGTFFPSNIESFAQGAWSADGRAAPARFASWGTVRGKERRTTLDFPAGQPAIRALIPTIAEEEREPLPPGIERDGIDTLSGVAFLMREAARTGRCDGAARLYDGRRVMAITARTEGPERLAPDYRSSYAGPTLRCAFEGRLLAGFLKDADDEDRRKPHPSIAWLAPLAPGRPPIPVRIQFEFRLFGHATAFIAETR